MLSSSQGREEGTCLYRRSGLPTRICRTLLDASWRQNKNDEALSPHISRSPVHGLIPPLQDAFSCSDERSKRNLYSLPPSVLFRELICILCMCVTSGGTSSFRPKGNRRRPSEPCKRERQEGQQRLNDSLHSSIVCLEGGILLLLCTRPGHARIGWTARVDYYVPLACRRHDSTSTRSLVQSKICQFAIYLWNLAPSPVSAMLYGNSGHVGHWDPVGCNSHPLRLVNPGSATCRHLGGGRHCPKFRWYWLVRVLVLPWETPATASQAKVGQLLGQERVYCSLGWFATDRSRLCIPCANTISASSTRAFLAWHATQLFPQQMDASAWGRAVAVQERGALRGSCNLFFGRRGTEAQQCSYPSLAPHPGTPEAFRNPVHTTTRHEGPMQHVDSETSTYAATNVHWVDTLRGGA